MADLLGTVQNLNGTFYAQDANGVVRELKVGDEIFQGEKIFGDISNGSSTLLQIATNVNEVLSLEGTQSLVFDATTNEYTFGNEEVAFNPNSAWLPNEGDAQVVADAGNTEAGDITDEEIAAGDETTTSNDPGNSQFDARAGATVDVSTTLRNDNFAAPTALEPEDDPFIFEDEIQVVEPQPEPEPEPEPQPEPENNAPSISVTIDNIIEAGDGKDVDGNVTANTPNLNYAGKLTATGQITATDPEGDPLIYGIINGNTVVSSLGGQYGELSINSTTGEFTYNLTDTVDELSQGVILTETFIVSVSDGINPARTEEVSITIVGTNDQPTLSVSSSVLTITEDGVVDDNGQPILDETGATVLSVGGTSAVADPDSFDTKTFFVGTQGQNVGDRIDDDSLSNSFDLTYGSVTVDGSGNYTYIVDPTKTQFLAENESKTETFTIYVQDKEGAWDAKDITVTIKGTNDAPTVNVEETSYKIVEEGVGKDASGNVSNDPNVAFEGILSASGTLTFDDVDTDIDTLTYTVAGKTTGSNVLEDNTINGENANDVMTNGKTQDGKLFVEDDYGTFTFDPVTGNYTFVAKAGENNPIENLNKGESITKEFTVTANDGKGGTVTSTIKVTIEGTNDAPELTVSNKTIIFNEDGVATGSASGQLGAIDADDKVSDTGNINHDYHRYDIKYSPDSKWYDYDTSTWGPEVGIMNGFDTPNYQEGTQWINPVYGQYGVMSLNPNTGEYEYKLYTLEQIEQLEADFKAAGKDTSAIDIIKAAYEERQNLGEGETINEYFDAYVSDRHNAQDLTPERITITINGENDVPTVTNSAVTTYDDTNDGSDVNTDNDNNAQTTTGSFIVDNMVDGNGGQVAINGTSLLDGNGNLIPNLTISGKYGTLSDFIYNKDSGEITYKYTQNGNQSHLDENDNPIDELKDEFTIKVSDKDGDTSDADTATGTITVTIVDDEPVIVNDYNEDITEALTASKTIVKGANEGDLNLNLKFGADGIASADGITINDVGGVYDEATSSYTFELDEGTFTLNSTGGYTINLKEGFEGTSLDLNLVIKDADGDTDSATIKLNIDSNDVPEISVAPDALRTYDDPTDSRNLNDTDNNARTAMGNLTVKLGDGTTYITISANGANYQIEVTPNANGTVTIDYPEGVLAGDYGNLDFTGSTYNAGTSEISLSYTYTQTVLGDHTTANGATSSDLDNDGTIRNNEDQLTDSFSVTVTDNDGIDANDSDTADIIVNVTDDGVEITTTDTKEDVTKELYTEYTIVYNLYSKDGKFIKETTDPNEQYQPQYDSTKTTVDRYTPVESSKVDISAFKYTPTTNADSSSAKVSGNMDFEGADGIVSTSADFIYLPVAGTSDFIDIEGMPIGISSVTNGDKVTYTAVNEANGVNETYFTLTYNTKEGTWNFNQMKPFDTEITLKFTATDKDGDTDTQYVVIQGTNDIKEYTPVPVTVQGTTTEDGVILKGTIPSNFGDDGAADDKPYDVNTPDGWERNESGGVVTLTNTATGSTFTLNQQTGDYTFKTTDIAVDKEFVFDYTLADKNGDIKGSTITIDAKAVQGDTPTGEETTTITTTSIPLNLAIVVDSSGSMGSHMTTVENALKDMQIDLNALRDKGVEVNICLVDYDTGARVVTTNLDDLDNNLWNKGNGGTNIDAGLSAAEGWFNTLQQDANGDPKGKNVTILLADGETAYAMNDTVTHTVKLASNQVYYDGKIYTFVDTHTDTSDGDSLSYDYMHIYKAEDGSLIMRYDEYYRYDPSHGSDYTRFDESDWVNVIVNANSTYAKGTALPSHPTDSYDISVDISGKDFGGTPWTTDEGFTYCISDDQSSGEIDMPRVLVTYDNGKNWTFVSIVGRTEDAFTTTDEEKNAAIETAKNLKEAMGKSGDLYAIYVDTNGEDSDTNAVEFLKTLTGNTVYTTSNTNLSAIFGNLFTEIEGEVTTMQLLGTVIETADKVAGVDIEGTTSSERADSFVNEILELADKGDIGTLTKVNDAIEAEIQKVTVDSDAPSTDASKEIIDGTGEDDVVIGFRDAETINGGAGHDVLLGGAGDDVLNGEDGNDIIIGGSGNDTIVYGTGDIADGGIGNDTIIFKVGNGFDFSHIDKIIATNFENVEIDLSGNEQADVLTSEQLKQLSGMFSGSSAQITIKGDEDDKIDFENNNWTKGNTVGGYTEYSLKEGGNDDPTLIIKVQDDLGIIV